MPDKHQLRRDMFRKLRDLRPVANTTDGRLRQPYRSPGDDGRTGPRGSGAFLPFLAGGGRGP